MKPNRKLNRLLRLRDVESYCGLKRTAIHHQVKAGTFPAPIPLSEKGRAKAWLEHEIAEWQGRRIASRRAGGDGR